MRDKNICKCEQRVLMFLGWQTFRFTSAGSGHPHSYVLAFCAEFMNPSLKDLSDVGGGVGKKDGKDTTPRTKGDDNKGENSLMLRKCKRIAERGMAYCNDACRTSLCCRFSA